MTTSIATLDGRQHELQQALLRLIAQSRLLRESTEGGVQAAAKLSHLLNERDELIRALEGLSGPGGEHVRALFDELEREDARTLAHLEAWRESLKNDLQSLSESRSALKGYARPAGPRTSLFERDL